MTAPIDHRCVPDEVAKVAKFMTEYPDTKAELSAALDSVGSDKYNLKLSKDVQKPLWII